MADEIFSVDGGCALVNYRVLGPIHNNIYCIEDGQGGVIVVDAEESAPRILDMVAGRPVSAIFVTHRHHDHVGALYDLREATGAPVYASAVDAPDIEDAIMPPFGQRPKSCTIDVKLEDGEEIQLGASTWKAILTPGHSPGSMCYYLDPAQSPRPSAAPLLISGDTLFNGTIGRTDFPGGDMKAMAVSLEKLKALPDETIVLPGHNEMTSIGAERVRTLEFYSQL